MRDELREEEERGDQASALFRQVRDAILRRAVDGGVGLPEAARLVMAHYQEFLGEDAGEVWVARLLLKGLLEGLEEDV